MNKNLNTKISLNDGVKVDMVTENDMSAEDRQAIFNREASVDAIPDLDILTGHVYDILTYLESPDVSRLMKTNDTAVKMYLNNKYADSVPLGIITLLMENDTREENVERLLKMFDMLKNAKNGKISLEDAEKKITDEVNNRYLYSKYGSKEGFEQALANEVKKEKSGKGKKNIESIRNTGKAQFKN